MARYLRYSFLDYLFPPPPLHLCFFVSILFLVLGFSWYINLKSMYEDFVNQIKLFFMLSPVLLQLLLLFFSGNIRFLVPEPEKDWLQGGGGSPWGVALVLVLLFYMIYYQSSFHERWFPFGA